MKHLLLIASAIFLFNNIFAQSTINNKGKYQNIYINSHGMTTNLPKQKTEPKGSVYMVDDWMNGTILLKDSSYISGYPFKYNMRSKYLEIKDDTDSIKVLYFAKVDLIFSQTVFGNEIYENCTNYIMQFPEFSDCEFVQVLAFGHATLLDKLTLEMIEANYNTAVDAGETSDTYFVKHNYYIIKNNQLIKIKKSKSSIVKALSDKEEEVKNYIKLNKLNLRETQNIVSVVKFYNSLHEEKTN